MIYYFLNQNFESYNYEQKLNILFYISDKKLNIQITKNKLYFKKTKLFK